MYSDGLVERRGELIDVGLQQLATAIEARRTGAVGDTCAGTLGTLTGPTAIDDDTVVVIVRCVTTAT